MNKFFSRLAVSCVLLLTATGVFAQNYPKPGSSTASAVLCAGCPGNNPSGQPNDGLPTFPYAAPIKAHVGRYIDSVNTNDWQSAAGFGFRTARAAKVVVASSQRGSAPPRLYMQIGSALAAYSLDTFFTTKLPAGMVDVGDAFIPDFRHSEKAIRPDTFVYPEAGGWKLYQVDSQDRLFDFDYDDRGYVYAAYSFYGWGILNDAGSSGFQLLQQVVDSTATLTIPDISVKGITSLKSGAEYYVLIFNPEQAGKVAVYNVTNPTTPVTTPREFIRRNQAIKYISKSAAGDRIAFVDVDNKIEIYDVGTYLNGGLPLGSFSPSPSRNFIGVSADKEGNFWAVEQSNNLNTNVLWRFSPSGGAFVATSFDVYGQMYNPSAIHVNDGYITTIGFEAGNSSSQAYNIRVYKIANGQPQAVDTKNYFRNYYHMSPAGYAMPQGYSNLLRDAVTVKWGSKLYMIYADHGLGDVYELQAGDSIVASYGPSFGTPNANSKATQVGPYIGDPITFTATATNPSFPLNLKWDFGNLEAGTANTYLNQTGQTYPYQYRGLSTAAQITAPKTVKVELANDASTSDSLTINLKVPTPRVVVTGTNDVITAATTGLAFVAGDTFTDGSDGSVESHTATYTISNVSTTTSPTGTVSVGALGNHTLTFTGAYGPYTTGTFAPVATPTYNAQISGVSYDVRPFVVSVAAPTAAGNAVTYTATSRRTTDTTIILPTATTWSVTWTLKNAGGADIIPPQPTPAAPIGTIPPFVVTDKSVISNNSVVAVTVTIATASLSTAAQPFATASATQAQVTPDPVISLIQGCTTTGAPCKVSATSVSSASTAGWSYAWTLNGAPTGVTTSTYEPTFSTPGTYTVGLTVTSGIFTVPAQQQTYTITGPPCGGLPTDTTMSIAVFGLTSGCRNALVGPSCTVGETLQLTAQAWGYTVQSCDSFSWNFGDGQQGSGQSVQHAFAGAGPYTISMTISNNSGSKTYTTTVSFGTGGGSGTCPAPTASFSYAGSQGCQPGVACKTGEIITFVASRANGGLQGCDSVLWNFGDFSSSSQATTTKAFSTASTYNVTVTVSNTSGAAQASQLVQVVTGDGGGNNGCSAPDRNRVDFRYEGQTTGCTSTNNTTTPCRRGEVVQFTATSFGYNYQNCDQFLWTFGDGGTSSERNPTHTFNGGAQGYEVSMKVFNTTDPNGAVVARTIRLTGGDPAKPSPELSKPTAPATAAKNVAITFSATSNIAATGWSWNFGDGTIDNSQSSLVGASSTIQHTYATAGHYIVTVAARNADDQFGSNGQATREIEILDTPQHRFLLPVVTRSTGFGGSTWRTDVQVFNPDPTVSPTNPLVLDVTFKGVTRQIEIASSTFISEDFIKYFTEGSDTGPMTISVLSSYQPQIWTRTYNLAANGTYGQFIPAILLSGDAHSATSLPTVETLQFIPGLRSGSAYRTNLGLVNPMDRALTVSVTAYNDKYEPIGSTQQQVQPFQLVQFSVDQVISSVPKDKPYTLKITVPANSWLISYASMVDQVSQDPTYIGAVSDNEVANLEFNDLVVPGVGHTGPWRSDVTIFNPDFEPTVVDLTYYNQEGEKAGESKNITIKGRNSLQLDDLLRAGFLTPQPADGIGSLRIRTTWPDTRRFPIAYSRTYNFNGISTFGQGIPAFSANRPNVKPSKPAFIPAIRNDADKSYYTNIGLVNLTDQPTRVRVTLLRFDTGAESNSLTYDLKPYQSTVGNILDALGGASRGSLKVSIEGSSGAVWAFASVIDRRTGDPEYLAGIPTP